MPSAFFGWCKPFLVAAHRAACQQYRVQWYTQLVQVAFCFGRTWPCRAGSCLPHKRSGFPSSRQRDRNQVRSPSTSCETRLPSPVALAFSRFTEILSWANILLLFCWKKPSASTREQLIFDSMSTCTGSWHGSAVIVTSLVARETSLQSTFSREEAISLRFSSDVTHECSS